jgi:enoyl-CoA hydratase/carnithine racemase
MSASRILSSLPSHLAPPASVLLAAPSPSTLLITLNRPTAFNALSLPQVNFLNPLYAHLSSTPDVDQPKVLLMKGADTTKKTKAFCSGGDVRQIYDYGMIHHQGGSGGDSSKTTSEDLCDEFFRNEYCLNHKISSLHNTTKTSQVSVWDGICMGGGAGLSIHGKYRVCTKRTTFAMPETGIGLFPDVGGGAWLPFVGPKGTKGWGEYLGLVGERVKGADGVRIGLGTHYVGEWEGDKEAAFLASVEGGASVGDALDSVAEMTYENADNARLPIDDDVERFFHGKDSVVAILDGLRSASDSSDFAAKTLDKMHKLSPTSMCVTFEQISKGREFGGDMEKVLAMEFAITQAMMREEKGDFYEGIRAVLVDKDNSPVWKYKIEDIESVRATVGEYFKQPEKPWTKQDA